MLRSKAILIMLLFACYWTYGQKVVNIFGIIRNGSGEGLAKATVLLTGATDTFRTISDNEGHFELRIPAITNSPTICEFELQVTMQGYKRYITSLSLNTEKHTYLLPAIVLNLQYEELVPVMVMSQKPITIMEDTVEFHAGAYKLRAGAELERLMKRLPGIDWDTAGNIMMEGKKITKVMINGADFLPGDIRLALRNIPADIIDKVQIIDDYGDKARLTGVKSGQSEKILNIILKQDKRNGDISTIEAGGGDKGRYNATLFSQLFSKDRQLTTNDKLANLSPSGDLHERVLDLMYSDKWSPKWSGSVRSSLWGDSHSSGSSMTQNSYFAGGRGSLNQNTQTTGSNRNQLLEFSQTYVPDVNTLLKVSAIMGLYNNRENNTTNYVSSEQDSEFVKRENSQSFNSSQYTKKALGSNFEFERTNPHSRQKLSIEADYRYFTKQQNEDDDSKIQIQADSLNNTSLQQYLIHTLIAHDELNTKISYFFPFGKESLVELGYAWTYSKVQNNRTVQAPDSMSGVPTTVDSLSNSYSLITIYNRIHAGYLAHTKKLNINLGLDAQPSNQQGKVAAKESLSYKYFRVLPLAQLSYSFSSSQKCILQYSGTSTPPAMAQLQPVTNLTNPAYPVQGNPKLKPSYSHSASLTFEHSSLKASSYWGYELGFNFSRTNNLIITDIVHPHDTSYVIQQTTYTNANGASSFDANYRLDLPPTVHKAIRVSAFGFISQSQSPFMTDNVVFLIHTRLWSQGLGARLVVPDKIEVDLTANYSSTFSRSPMGNYSYPGFTWSLRCRQEVFSKWRLQYKASQVFTHTEGNSFTANPILLNTTIERDIFSKNQAKITISINDLLNNSTGVTQSTTPAATTEYRSNLIGRYFLITMVLKLETFAQKIEHSK